MKNIESVQDVSDEFGVIDRPGFLNSRDQVKDGLDSGEA